MRISGFLVGGIVGIAAAAYMTRKNPGSLAWAARTTDGLVTGVKHMMIEKALDRKFGADTRETKKQAGAQQTTGDSSSWNTIESIVNADPNVKRQAEAIMAEASATGGQHAEQARH